MSNSVTPSDSVSTTSKGKKPRPGKSQRLAARGYPTNNEPSNAPSSMSGAQAFAAGVQGIPIPQPGKYPVVFPSGAGEPTRDAMFSYDIQSLAPVVSDLPDRFVANSRYSEFAANAGVEDTEFNRRVIVGFLLGLAQQTVHAHANMGLPIGDFSVVATSDVYNFSSIRSILSQFGEFSVEAIGSRFLLADYPSTVRSLVRAAVAVDKSNDASPLLLEWLPTCVGDGRSKLLVANRLSELLRPFGVKADVLSLSEEVFHHSSPTWDVLKLFLGDDPGDGEVDTRDRFNFLFSSYPTEAAFLSAVGNPARRGVLQELGLDWPHPLASDLAWGANTKNDFSVLSDKLARSKASYSKFFSIGSGLSNRSAAAGSSAQISAVSYSKDVVLVKSLVAQSAPEYSLLVCFPFCGVFPDIQEYKVVLSTSLNVSQRATEFAQLDWL